MWGNNAMQQLTKRNRINYIITDISKITYSTKIDIFFIFENLNKLWILIFKKNGYTLRLFY